VNAGRIKLSEDEKKKMKKKEKEKTPLVLWLERRRCGVVLW
jgi:hypothetical protein